MKLIICLGIQQKCRNLELEFIPLLGKILKAQSVDDVKLMTAFVTLTPFEIAGGF